MIIKIDTREKSLIETFKEYYPTIPISVEQLDIGDVIITNDYCNILIERKTICDALASIKDCRWMKSCNSLYQASKVACRNN